MMTVFPIVLSLIGMLFAWQLFAYLRFPRFHPGRKSILLRLIVLMVIVGFVTYGWRSALLKFAAIAQQLTIYPGASMDITRTPIFADTPYWTFTAEADPTEVFNWYRSRAKHAGWTVAEEGGHAQKVFVVVSATRNIIYVVLDPLGATTRITYTKEGTLIRSNPK